MATSPLARVGLPFCPTQPPGPLPPNGYNVTFNTGPSLLIRIPARHNRAVLQNTTTSTLPPVPHVPKRNAARRRNNKYHTRNCDLDVNANGIDGKQARRATRAAAGVGAGDENRLSATNNFGKSLGTGTGKNAGLALKASTGAAKAGHL